MAVSCTQFFIPECTDFQTFILLSKDKRMNSCYLGDESPRSDSEDDSAGSIVDFIVNDSEESENSDYEGSDAASLISETTESDNDDEVDARRRVFLPRKAKLKPPEYVLNPKYKDDSNDPDYIPEQMRGTEAKQRLTADHVRRFLLE
jgi:hypothetical protein